MYKLLLTTGVILLALATACEGTEPTASPDPRIDEILDRLESLDSRVRDLETQPTIAIPTPTPTFDASMEHNEAMATETPALTPTDGTATTGEPAVQEIGIIETYPDPRFFPKWIG